MESKSNLQKITVFVCIETAIFAFGELAVSLFPDDAAGVWLIVSVLALLTAFITWKIKPRRSQSFSVDANPVNWSFHVSQPKVTLTRPPWYRRACLKIRSWARDHLGQAATAKQVNRETEKRIYTKRKVGEIFAAIRKNNITTLDRENLSRPHIGKWIRIQHVIQDISLNENYVYVTLGHVFGPSPRLRFKRGRWWPEIETMTKGDRLAAQGRITGIHLMGLSMVDCEIVDQREDNDVLRQPKATGTAREIKP